MFRFTTHTSLTSRSWFRCSRATRSILEVPTLTFTIYPWETINLWDVLGPDVFDAEGTAAIIAYADPSLRCDPIEDCHFLVTSRTYTPEQGGDGEYGLTVPGAAISSATDWSTYGYAAGVLNDGDFFRCNAGVASWTPDWTRVRLDIQNADGQIVTSEVFDVPPYGHVQRRLLTSGYRGLSRFLSRIRARRRFDLSLCDGDQPANRRCELLLCLIVGGRWVGRQNLEGLRGPSQESGGHHAGRRSGAQEPSALTIG